MNWIVQNIKIAIICWIVGSLWSGCNDGVIEEKPVNSATITPQETFVRNLSAKGLLMGDSSGHFYSIVASLLKKSRFSGGFNFNSRFDSSKLNIFLFNSDRDTSLRNICAFIGKNTIVMDKVFLNDYLRGMSFFKKLDKLHFDSLNYSFQLWVISHEIAHADLNHAVGHFINYTHPKTQEQARQFQGLEIDADKKSLLLWDTPNRRTMQEMFIRLFNSDYDKLYTIDTANRNLYLKVIQDPYLTYPYKLSGSHPTMVIRTGIMLYLMDSDPSVKKEAYQFLVQSQIHLIRELSPIP